MSTSLSKKLQSAFSSNLSPSLLAGFITAIVGIAAFGIIHAYIIEPIWRSLPGGIPFGLIGGAAMGWAFYELHASGKVSLTVRGGAVFGLSLWLMLIPMTSFDVLLGESGIREFMRGWGDVVEFVEFMIAASTGALVGWLLTHSWRAAGALGAAMLSLALVMGRPIPVMNSGRAAGLFGAFLPVYVVSGISLVIALSQIIKMRERGQQRSVQCSVSEGETQV